MVIRWLGAFTYSSDLQGSLKYELRSDHQKGSLRCAERLIDGAPRIYEHIRIGMLVRNAGVVRKFKHDVMSHSNEDGWMAACRHEHKELGHQHTECWVRPDYIGIVLRAGGAPVSKQSLRILRDASKKFGVPIFKLCRDGKLVKVAITAG